MGVEFQISERDYVEGGVLNTDMTQTSLTIHVLIDTLLVVAGVIVLKYYDGLIGSMLIGAGIGAWLFPWILKKTYLPFWLKRHYRKFPLMHKKVKIDFTDSGIQHTSEGGFSDLKWNELVNWRENKELMLLYVAPKMYHLVPKRVSESGFPLDELRQKLTSEVGDAI